MGLYKRGGTWWMSYIIPGAGQHCETTGTNNKRLARKILDMRRAEIVEGRYANLLKANVPKLNDWAEKYLESIQHLNTRRRYAVSKKNLVSFFGKEAQLDHITKDWIEQFKQKRRKAGVKAATLNRDLRFLAQILKQAERERYIARSPFDLTKFFLNESRERRKPHILTLKEQDKLLSIANPRIRVLTVLGTETGMRTGEMLSLRWGDINFLDDVLQVKQSKTPPGIRSVPLSVPCKTELLCWRNLIGTEFSEWVFPNFSNRRHPLQGGRKAWASTLKKAGLPYFPIYYLRHTFASRLTSAGVSPLTIAQMLGHSSTQIVPRYAQIMDQNRLDAMKSWSRLNNRHRSNRTPGKQSAVRKPAMKYRSSRPKSTTNLLQCCISGHSNAECNFANQMLD
jgi:integrase